MQGQQLGNVNRIVPILTRGLARGQVIFQARTRLQDIAGGDYETAAWRSMLNSIAHLFSGFGWRAFDQGFTVDTAKEAKFVTITFLE